MRPHPATRLLGCLMAAAVAFVGSAALLKAGRAFPRLAGGAAGTGQPGFLLLAVVILLGVLGGLLLVIAGKELLELRRRPHVR